MTAWLRHDEMDEPPVADGWNVLDADGTRLAVGQRVARWDDAEVLGVVTEITEPDADYNDATERAEEITPRVKVQLTDGQVERFVSVNIASMYEADRYVCDDVKVLP